jgi:glycogen debranching enzyme
MAELFTNSSELDAMFCQKLNLNGLVREMQNRYDTGSLGAYFHHLTCQDKPVGCIDDRFTDLTGRPYKTLKASKPDDMIYDCTHDNESPLGKFQTGRIALPHIGLSSLADCSVASTWGIDFLMKDQIHCVSEKRLYPIYDQSGFVVPE